jgi:hypothetical protein
MPEQTLVKNVELARKVREHTRRFPEVLDMADWLQIGSNDYNDADIRAAGDITTTCGTTACFAGWTVLLGGYELDEDGYVYRGGNPVIRMQAFEFKPGSFPVKMHSDQLARELLGIEQTDASKLFYCAAEDLDGKLFEIFGEEI